MSKRFDPSIRVHELRTVRAEFRADDKVEGRVTARVLTYGTVDSYGTTFAKGVFNASMKDRMPRIVMNHDWGNVVGVWQSFAEDDGGLTLTGQLDDFDAVPEAKRAWAQLKSGSLDQFSVGFWPEDAREVIVDGTDVLEFTRGTLDEASLVMVGAVPGTKTVSLRTHQGFDSAGLVEQVAAAVAAGDGTEDIVARVEAALLTDDTEEVVEEDDDGATSLETTEEQDLDDETLMDLDDELSGDWTAEDVLDWAVLADEGDEAAVLALQTIADEYEVDSDDYATWAEFVDATLIEHDAADDVPAAGDATPPPSEADSAGDSTDTAAEDLDADIAAAFQVLDDLA